MRRRVMAPGVLAYERRSIILTSNTLPKGFDLTI
jgi:hypothetical protein